jgi:5'-nucleotidase
MATLQGYYGNIPSLAVSLFPQKRDEELDFNFAAEVAEKLAVNIKNGKLKTNAVLNVNVPNIPRQKIKGILITRTADTGYVKPSRIQGEKMMKYTLVPDYSRFGAIAENTDLWAINAGYISISPLRFEPTHHESIPSIKKCVQTMEGEFWENARF